MSFLLVVFLILVGISVIGAMGERAHREREQGPWS